MHGGPESVAEADVASCARSLTHQRHARPRVLVASLAPAADAAKYAADLRYGTFMSRQFGEEGRRLSYGSYLRLLELLQLQTGLSEEHADLLFIVPHQAYELWFKVLLH